jgi:hypothetical protein
VPDPEIFDMPMEFGLELMTIIRAHLANAEWKLFDDMIDLSPKFPPALCGVLGAKSVTLGGHFVHRLSLQKLHRGQVSQC